MHGDSFSERWPGRRKFCSRPAARASSPTPRRNIVYGPRRHFRGGPPGGFGGPMFGPPFGFRRGRRRRGDVRTALLLLLGEEPRNGYQLMQAIEERSGGRWRPSPGRSTRRSPSSRTRA